MIDEKKINIANILRYCPMGTRLYSPLFGAVELLSIGDDVDYKYPISVRTEEEGFKAEFTEEGYYIHNFSNAQCLLFPSSEMRDWSKFFKRGDVVVSENVGMTVVFEGWATDDYRRFHTTIEHNDEEEMWSHKLYEEFSTKDFVKATDNQRAEFIEEAEVHFGGKYNHETLQVEPEKPKCSILAFDRVLVRDSDDSIWRAEFFSHYLPNKNFPYVCLGTAYRQCIPYNEHTAHLLDTTDSYTEGGSE